MTDTERRERLEKHVQAFEEIKQMILVLYDEKWEHMNGLLEACTAGAMAIQRIIREDFGESEGEG